MHSLSFSLSQIWDIYIGDAKEPWHVLFVYFAKGEDVNPGFNAFSRRDWKTGLINQALQLNSPWGRGVHSSDATDYRRAGWDCWQCRSAQEHTWALSVQRSPFPLETERRVKGALAGTQAHWMVQRQPWRLKVKKTALKRDTCWYEAGQML